ncbi:hypothetical protein F5Y10DRAFT_142275 [Nemania abortiva]|nr:hypothetical protein F5Y10DRAFT_142275 [Nemania abortiva]
MRHDDQDLRLRRQCGEPGGLCERLVSVLGPLDAIVILKSRGLIQFIFNSRLSTTNCTNIYHIQDRHCNLHAGAYMHKPVIYSPYTYYDARCFFRQSSCRPTSLQPMSAK